MKNFGRGLAALIAATALSLTACSGTGGSNKTSAPAESKAATSQAAESPAAQAASGAAKATLNPVDAEGNIEVTDAHGTQKIKPNPQRVVLLDNRTFETLEDWGVKPLALPKGVMPKTLDWTTDDSIADIGNHREPNYDVITAADPDFVLVGQRFSQHYDDIKAAAPNAQILDLNVELPKEASDPKAKESGQILVGGLAQDVTTLGQIFGHEEDAAKLVDDLNASIDAARAAYDGQETILAVNTSGGKIGFLDPNVGRVFGPLYNLLNWKPALFLESGTDNHKGDEVSEEAIAQANPDFIMIMDRDAAVSSTEGKTATPGKDLVKESQALETVNAVKNDKLYVAPADTYTNEGIQTFTEIFNDFAKIK